MKYNSAHFILALDLAGSFVFAVEGGLAAVRADLDFIGFMVLAFVTALFGGIIRDLLIGAAPPNAIRDWRYGTGALLGGVIVFFLNRYIQQVPAQVITVLDAGGLALCAVSGSGKALEYKINPFIAVLLGAVTGVGGGTVRDVLLAHVPHVLQAEVYATAALAGAAVLVIGLKLNLSPNVMACAGGLVCFTLRLVSVWQHWNLPTAIR